MKVLIFTVGALVAVFGLVAAYPKNQEKIRIDQRGIIENTINSTLNNILANLSDPIDVDSAALVFDNGDIISGGLNVSNLRINGIKSLVASEISLNIFTQALTLTLEISELSVAFKYWADVVVLELVPLYGDGRINIVFDDIILAIKGAANLTGGLSLKDISVVITLGESTFDLTGLINNPEFSSLVSNALNDNFSDFINDNSDVISSVISPIIEEVINSVLEGSDSESVQKYEYRVPEPYHVPKAKIA